MIKYERKRRGLMKVRTQKDYCICYIDSMDSGAVSNGEPEALQLHCPTGPYDKAGRRRKPLLTLPLPSYYERRTGVLFLGIKVAQK